MAKREWPSSGFGRLLRRERERAGLTQEQLAERAGCHTLTVAKLEGGVHEPAWPLVLLLAGALGAPVTAFVPDVFPAPADEGPRRPRGRPAKAK